MLMGSGALREGVEADAAGAGGAGAGGGGAGVGGGGGRGEAAVVLAAGFLGRKWWPSKLHLCSGSMDQKAPLPCSSARRATLRNPRARLRLCRTEFCEGQEVSESLRE